MLEGVFYYYAATQEVLWLVCDSERGDQRSIINSPVIQLWRGDRIGAAQMVRHAGDEVLATAAGAEWISAVLRRLITTG